MIQAISLWYKGFQHKLSSKIVKNILKNKKYSENHPSIPSKPARAVDDIEAVGEVTILSLQY